MTEDLIPAIPPKRLTFSQKYFLGVVTPLVALLFFGTLTLTSGWPIRLSPQTAEIFVSSSCVYPPCGPGSGGAPQTPTSPTGPTTGGTTPTCSQPQTHFQEPSQSLENTPLLTLLWQDLKALVSGLQPEIFTGEDCPSSAQYGSGGNPANPTPPGQETGPSWQAGGDDPCSRHSGAHLQNCLQAVAFVPEATIGCSDDPSKVCGIDWERAYWSGAPIDDKNPDSPNNRNGQQIDERVAWQQDNRQRYQDYFVENGSDPCSAYGDRDECQAYSLMSLEYGFALHEGAVIRDGQITGLLGGQTLTVGSGTVTVDQMLDQNYRQSRELNNQAQRSAALETIFTQNNLSVTYLYQAIANASAQGQDILASLCTNPANCSPNQNDVLATVALFSDLPQPGRVSTSGQPGAPENVVRPTMANNQDQFVLTDRSTLIIKPIPRTGVGANQKVYVCQKDFPDNCVDVDLTLGTLKQNGLVYGDLERINQALKDTQPLKVRSVDTLAPSVAARQTYWKAVVDNDLFCVNGNCYSQSVCNSQNPCANGLVATGVKLTDFANGYMNRNLYDAIANTAVETKKNAIPAVVEYPSFGGYYTTQYYQPELAKTFTPDDYVSKITLRVPDAPKPITLLPTRSLSGHTTGYRAVAVYQADGESRQTYQLDLGLRYSLHDLGGSGRALAQSGLNPGQGATMTDQANILIPRFESLLQNTVASVPQEARGKRIDSCVYKADGERSCKTATGRIEDPRVYDYTYTIDNNNYYFVQKTDDQGQRHFYLQNGALGTQTEIADPTIFIYEPENPDLVQNALALAHRQTVSRYIPAFQSLSMGRQYFALAQNYNLLSEAYHPLLGPTRGWESFRLDESLISAVTSALVAAGPTSVQDLENQHLREAALTAARERDCEQEVDAGQVRSRCSATDTEGNPADLTTGDFQNFWTGRSVEVDPSLAGSAVVSCEQEVDAGQVRSRCRSLTWKDVIGRIDPELAQEFSFIQNPLAPEATSLAGAQLAVGQSNVLTQNHPLYDKLSAQVFYVKNCAPAAYQQPSPECRSGTGRASYEETLQWVLFSPAAVGNEVNRFRDQYDLEQILVELNRTSGKNLTTYNMASWSEEDLLAVSLAFAAVKENKARALGDNAKTAALFLPYIATGVVTGGAPLYIKIAVDMATDVVLLSSQTSTYTAASRRTLQWETVAADSFYDSPGITNPAMKFIPPDPLRLRNHPAKSAMYGSYMNMPFSQLETDYRQTLISAAASTQNSEERQFLGSLLGQDEQTFNHLGYGAMFSLLIPDPNAKLKGFLGLGNYQAFNWYALSPEERSKIPPELLPTYYSYALDQRTWDQLGPDEQSALVNAFNERYGYYDIYYGGNEPNTFHPQLTEAQVGLLFDSTKLLGNYYQQVSQGSSIVQHVNAPDSGLAQTYTSEYNTNLVFNAGGAVAGNILGNAIGAWVFDIPGARRANVEAAVAARTWREAVEENGGRVMTALGENGRIYRVPPYMTDVNLRTNPLLSFLTDPVSVKPSNYIEAGSITRIVRADGSEVVIKTAQDLERIGIGDTVHFIENGVESSFRLAPDNVYGVVNAEVREIAEAVEQNLSFATRRLAPTIPRISQEVDELAAREALSFPHIVIKPQQEITTLADAFDGTLARAVEQAQAGEASVVIRLADGTEVPIGPDEILTTARGQPLALDQAPSGRTVYVRDRAQPRSGGTRVVVADSQIIVTPVEQPAEVIAEATLDDVSAITRAALGDEDALVALGIPHISRLAPEYQALLNAADDVAYADAIGALDPADPVVAALQARRAAAQTAIDLRAGGTATAEEVAQATTALQQANSDLLNALATVMPPLPITRLAQQVGNLWQRATNAVTSLFGRQPGTAVAAGAPTGPGLLTRAHDFVADLPNRLPAINLTVSVDVRRPIQSFRDTLANLRRPAGGTELIAVEHPQVRAYIDEFVTAGKPFDSEAELETITQLSRAARSTLPPEEATAVRQQYFQAYRELLVRQQITFANIYEAVSKEIRELPPETPLFTADIERLLTTVDEMGQPVGMTSRQRQVIVEALEEIQVRHRKIIDLRNQYSDSELFEYLFRAPPRAQVEVEITPVFIRFKTTDPLDYAYAYTKNAEIATKPVQQLSVASKRALDVAKSTGGFAQEVRDGIRVNVIQPSEFYRGLRNVAIEDTIAHEEQHEVNRVVRERFLAAFYPPANLDRLPPLEKEFVGAEAVYREQAADEILAKLFENEPPSKIYQSLTRYDFGIYDYKNDPIFQEVDYREFLGSATSPEEMAEISHLYREVLVDSHEQSIDNALQAFQRLRLAGYSKEEVVALLQTVPLDRWQAYARRLADLGNLRPPTTLRNNPVVNALFGAPQPKSFRTPSTPIKLSGIIEEINQGKYPNAFYFLATDEVIIRLPIDPEITLDRVVKSLTTGEITLDDLLSHNLDRSQPLAVFPFKRQDFLELAESSRQAQGPTSPIVRAWTEPKRVEVAVTPDNLPEVVSRGRTLRLKDGTEVTIPTQSNLLGEYPDGRILFSPDRTDVIAFGWYDIFDERRMIDVSDIASVYNESPKTFSEKVLDSVRVILGGRPASLAPEVTQVRAPATVLETEVTFPVDVRTQYDIPAERVHLSLDDLPPVPEGHIRLYQSQGSQQFILPKAVTPEDQADWDRIASKLGLEELAPEERARLDELIHKYPGWVPAETDLTLGDFTESLTAAQNVSGRGGGDIVILDIPESEADRFRRVVGFGNQAREVFADLPMEYQDRVYVLAGPTTISKYSQPALPSLKPPRLSLWERLPAQWRRPTTYLKIAAGAYGGYWIGTNGALALTTQTGPIADFLDTLQNIYYDLTTTSSREEPSLPERALNSAGVAGQPIDTVESAQNYLESRYADYYLSNSNKKDKEIAAFLAANNVECEAAGDYVILPSKNLLVCDDNLQWTGECVPGSVAITSSSDEGMLTPFNAQAERCNDSYHFESADFGRYANTEIFKEIFEAGRLIEEIYETWGVEIEVANGMPTVEMLREGVIPALEEIAFTFGGLPPGTKWTIDAQNPEHIILLQQMQGATGGQPRGNLNPAVGGATGKDKFRVLTASAQETYYLQDGKLVRPDPDPYHSLKEAIVHEYFHNQNAEHGFVNTPQNEFTAMLAQNYQLTWKPITDPKDAWLKGMGFKTNFSVPAGVHLFTDYCPNASECFSEVNEAALASPERLLGQGKTQEFMRQFYQKHYGSPYDFAAQMDETAIIRALSIYSSVESSSVPISSDNKNHFPLYQAAFEDFRTYLLKDQTTLAALARMKTASPQQYQVVNTYLNGAYSQYDQDTAQRVIDALEAWHWATRFSDVAQFQRQEIIDPQRLFTHYYDIPEREVSQRADRYLEDFTWDYYNLYHNSETREGLSALCQNDRDSCGAIEQIRDYYEQTDPQTLSSQKKADLVRALVILNQVSYFATRDVQQEGPDQVRVSADRSAQLQERVQALTAN